MSKIMYKGISYANAGVSSDATSIPIADMTAAFDNTAHMNSTDMTSQEVEDFVDGLDAQGANLADYVVEQGTSDIWTYRKWNSGIAECWGTYTNTTSHYAQSLGGYGYQSDLINFPTNLFISTPIPSFSARIGNGFALTGTQTGSLSATGSTFYAISPSSGSQTCYWYIHVIGRWK